MASIRARLAARFISKLSVLPVNTDPQEVARARRAMARLTALSMPPPGVARSTEEVGNVAGEWHIPKTGDEGRVILYLHGGGFSVGSPKSHRSLASRLALACGARVFVADYRLAPEHPFPAALEDSKRVYGALLDRGIEPSRLFVAGDSAGGSLTLATLLAVRDDGAPLPAAGVCISPSTDLARTGESMKSKAAEDPMLRQPTLDTSVELYLGDRDPKTPLASPLYAELAGLPPLLIHVGSREVLLSDAERFAERAKAAGVDVTLFVAEGMIHVWHAFAPLVPEATAAIGDIGKFVRSA